MAKQRHLSNAPIKEALIDLRVTPREGLTFDQLQSALEGRFAGYHDKGQILEQHFELRVDGVASNSGASLNSRKVGVRLHSADERHVAQCQIQGFTLSRLTPYEDWDRLVEEARRLWVIYRQVLEPQAVVRCAARFINDLQLPMKAGDSYQKYLNKLVDLPAGTPQAVSRFLQRFELTDTARNANVNLTLAMQSGYVVEGAPVPVVLDIDCYSACELGPDSAELWSRIAMLRDVKNECFFGVLTEPAVELYE
jgi:uncharacterized protein (TIGR04255 family)